MLSILPVVPAHLDALIAISQRTFYETFFHLTSYDDFSRCTAAAYHPDKLLSELNSPDSEFYFAMIDDHPADYLKINFNAEQTVLKDGYGMEIQRIYVLQDHQGKHIGKALLDFALNRAAERNLRYVWLDVWEKNPVAIRFYELNGFRGTGKHTFPFDEEVDSHWLMRREL